jgi:hemoglobin
MERSVCDPAGGSAALVRLATAWHRRCLQDPVVSHAFSHPGLHPQHVQRLATYWGEALGGPAGYTAGMGDHSHMLRLHAGNGEHAEMHRRAQQCFALALDDAGVPGDPLRRRTDGLVRVDDDRDNGNVRNGWRRWIPGSKHGLPRSVAVCGVPRPDADRLDGLLGRCEQLRTWARAHSLELDGAPEELGLLDHALDETIDQVRASWAGRCRSPPWQTRPVFSLAP